MTTSMRARLAAIGCAVCVTAACAPKIQSTATEQMTPRRIAELWEEPRNIGARDLFWGQWGQKVAPKPGQIYTVLEETTTGFSPGFTGKDQNGTEWSVKQGPESQTEVAVSRILSAVGYHQPPVYYVKEWTQRGGPGPEAQKSGRFRPKGVGIDDVGTWSWQQNPFVGTAPYGGLLATLMLLNSTDLKNDNNTLYQLDDTMRSRSQLRRWYVVRDVGAALGETGKIEPRRGDPFVFEKTPFILGVEKGFVRFNYAGRHQELASNITPGDMRWMVRLVSRLSEKQWRDAFRAGGYGPTASEMFITRIREKLAEARALRS